MKPVASVFTAPTLAISAGKSRCTKWPRTGRSYSSESPQDVMNNTARAPGTGCCSVLTSVSVTVGPCAAACGAAPATLKSATTSATRLTYFLRLTTIPDCMAAKRFLITGGSQGIGAWLVAHARKAGHQVVFTGRNRSRVEEVARETGAHGVVADVSVDADNARAVQACMQEMSGIDVLINNAGVGYSAEIGSID